MSGSGVADGQTFLSRFEGFVALYLQVVLRLVVGLGSIGWGIEVEVHCMLNFVSLDCE